MPESAIVQNEQSQRLEVKLRRELGDTILSLLDDDAVEDIVLNPDATLWVKQMGSGFTRVGQMSGSQAVCAMNTIASMRSMVLNYERPVLETELPLDGSRFEGLIPPVVRHPGFAIRRRPQPNIHARSILPVGHSHRQNRSTESLAQTREFRRSIGRAVACRCHPRRYRCEKEHSHGRFNRLRERRHLRMRSSTGSQRLSPHDRVISIEDTTELQCSVANYVDLRAVGSITMLDCLRACMRLKPSRIVVGEVRGAEAHTMLKAWNTGHPGGAATVHANDALSGLIRLESLVAEATSALSSS